MWNASTEFDSRFRKIIFSTFDRWSRRDQMFIEKIPLLFFRPLRGRTFCRRDLCFRKLSMMFSCEWNVRPRWSRLYWWKLYCYKHMTPLGSRSAFNTEILIDNYVINIYQKKNYIQIILINYNFAILIAWGMTLLYQPILIHFKKWVGKI